MPLRVPSFVSILAQIGNFAAAQTVVVRADGGRGHRPVGALDVAGIGRRAVRYTLFFEVRYDGA